MREDRFFVDFKISKGEFEIKNKEIFHQLKNVLRKRVGDRVIVFNGGIEGVAKIRDFYFKDKKIKIEILEIKQNKREPEIFASLFCSILKKENFELVAQKATEVGIKEIVPLICKNTIKLGLNLERLKKIIKEASEQSGRGELPEILKPMEFKKAIERAKNFDLKILFDPSGENFFKFKREKIKTVAIFIGPEGGWDKKEIEMAQKENFEILNLGKLILRAETAGVVASFLATNFFGFDNLLDF